jgi:hypothetical protein
MGKKVYFQVGVFTTKNEPAAAIMFPVDCDDDISKLTPSIVAHATRVWADYLIKKATDILPPEEIDNEKMANAILGIYHKVSAQPVLLESVAVKRADNKDVITITLKGDQ